MLVHNLTSFPVVTAVTSRKPPRPEMVVVVKASFALGRSGLTPIEALPEMHALSGDVFREDDEDRSGESLYGSDFAEFKLNAEVLLTGHAYAPGRKPVTELGVSFSVGEWSKSLRVIGPRVFSDGISRGHSDPLPFTKMELSYRNAFGGPGHDGNPVGKGASSDELPTVEVPSEPMRGRGDKVATGTFAPVSPYWRARAERLGRDYGSAWQEHRKPFRPADFDWKYFSAAPTDQQLPGYLRGDEEVVLQNLHEEVEVLRARLPGFRVRVFVHDTSGRFREAPVSLDTLYVDTDRNLLVLTWRAVDGVDEDDLADVKTLLIVKELLAEPKLAESHYKSVVEEFERDPVGLEAAVPPELRDTFFKRPPNADQPSSDNPVIALLDKKLPGAFGEHRQELVTSVERGSADPKVKAKMEEELAAIATAEQDVAPVPPVKKPGTFPELHLRRIMRRILEQSREARKAAEAALGANQEVSPKVLAKIDEAAKVPFDPKWNVFDPEYTPPIEPISTDEPGPRRKLSEQDLTGRDLSGSDLSGANLSQAILTRANLRGANLSGANLRGATLYRADLRGANLTSADLTRANFAKANLEEADLGKATLTCTFFEAADLRSARLDGTTGEYAMFMKADASRARFVGADLPHADFAEATLADANFTAAKLSKSCFDDARAIGARFVDACVAGSGFARAVLAFAKLVGVDAQRCFLVDAQLDDIDGSVGIFIGSHFSRSSMKNAKLFGANLKECRLYRADLRGATLERANLFAADLCKAKLDQASFRGASLYDAKLLKASGKGTDFTDAILHQSTLVR